MPQFKKWGKHIRASDKSLVFRFSAGSLLLLFLAMIILLNLKAIVTTDWESVSFLQDGSVHFSVTPYRMWKAIKGFGKRAMPVSRFIRACGRYPDTPCIR